MDDVTGRAIRIGTRGSPLALKQAQELGDRLVAAHGLDHDGIAVTVIKTSGDRIQDRPLSEVGGKGLFTKEIEDALMAGAIDVAVHSMKDVATVLPAALAITCLLPREDVRDAFISRQAADLMSLTRGAVVGTSSLRRQAQVKLLRSDLQVITFRGNVETRLRKLGEGVADATLLAMAGLKRLGMADRATAIMAPEQMLPAVAQGAIGIEVRQDDSAMQALLAPLNDTVTALCVTAERAFLARLDGSCKTPIAGLATFDGELLHFRGQILAPDGSESYATERRGPAKEAAAMGADAAAELLRRAGPKFRMGA